MNQSHAPQFLNIKNTLNNPVVLNHCSLPLPQTARLPTHLPPGCPTSTSWQTQCPAFPPNHSLACCPQPSPCHALLSQRFPSHHFTTSVPSSAPGYHPRLSPLDLVSVSLLWVPLFQSTLYLLQEWSDRWWLPIACVMQPKLPWRTSRSRLTPHHPAPASWALATPSPSCPEQSLYLLKPLPGMAFSCIPASANPTLCFP